MFLCAIGERFWLVGARRKQKCVRLANGKSRDIVSMAGSEKSLYYYLKRLPEETSNWATETREKDPKATEHFAVGRSCPHDICPVTSSLRTIRTNFFITIERYSHVQCIVAKRSEGDWREDKEC